MATPVRNEKIKRVLEKRQSDLTVVIEDVTDPHNVSAILRTCDAVGVLAIHLVYHSQEFPRLSSKSSSSALKWVKRFRHPSIEDCYKYLRQQAFIIGATSLGTKSQNLFELDWSKKTAIVLGNEHSGVSVQAARQADFIFEIPMVGMVQSLNVSVAAAVILYESYRQRSLMGKYESSAIHESEIAKLRENWLNNIPFGSENRIKRGNTR